MSDEAQPQPVSVPRFPQDMTVLPEPWVWQWSVNEKTGALWLFARSLTVAVGIPFDDGDLVERALLGMREQQAHVLARLARTAAGEPETTEVVDHASDHS